MTAQYSAGPNKGMKRLVFLFVAIIVILAYYYRDTYSAHLPTYRTSTAGKSFRAIDIWRNRPNQKKHSESLWKSLTACLQEGRPTVDPPHHAKVDDAWYNDPAKPDYRIEMSTEDIKAMRSTHDRYRQCSSKLSLDSAYLAGERGIVTTAGGKYIPVFLVSLRLLRKTGSTLPVEVFLANEEEYEPHFCETILPSLNARCRILSRDLGVAANFTLESYQYKIFSILLSSFEDVLFLDADNLALNDPTPYFDSAMYQGFGMVSEASETASYR